MMELDEMKNLWQEISLELEKQKKLTDNLIIKMTQEKYRNKFRSIKVSEVIGSLICFAGFFIILINFGALNTWYLLACGALSAFLLFLLPILSLRALNRLQNINISSNNYKQTLIDYAAGKRQFLLIQRGSFYLSFLILLLLVPVMAQIKGGKDIFVEAKVWIWFAPLAMPFLFYFARWVFRHYVKVADDTENLLKELES